MMRLLSSTYLTLHIPHDNEPEETIKENSENNRAMHTYWRAFWRIWCRQQYLWFCCPSCEQALLRLTFHCFIHRSPNFKTTGKIYNIRQVKLIFMLVVFTKEPLKDPLNLTFHWSLTMIFNATQERGSSVPQHHMISAWYLQWDWEAVRW